jgi:uncharacterized membrane protein
MSHERESRIVNMTDPERIASIVLGGLLAGYGARRRDRAGAALAVLGGLIALRGVSGASTFYDRLGIRRFSGARGARNALRGTGVRVGHSVVIRRPIDAVYRFWRELENLPRFMTHLIAVRPLGNNRYRWVAKAPAGRVTWDAEIIDEQVPWRIAWRSVPGSRIQNAGTVRFGPAPDGEGTEVTVELAYKPPAGALGALVARLSGEEPTRQVREDLERFRDILEGTGLDPEPGRGRTRSSHAGTPPAVSAGARRGAHRLRFARGS